MQVVSNPGFRGTLGPHCCRGRWDPDLSPVGVAIPPTTEAFVGLTQAPWSYPAVSLLSAEGSSGMGRAAVRTGPQPSLTQAAGLEFKAWPSQAGRDLGGGWQRAAGGLAGSLWWGRGTTTSWVHRVAGVTGVVSVLGWLPSSETQQRPGS